MDCPDCAGEMIAFVVPKTLREYPPGEESVVALCSRCLGLQPAPDAEPVTDAGHALGGVSEAFPDEEETAPAMALLVGLLSSLALYRAEIGALTRRLERAGIDVLLALDRLGADPGLDPAVDLDRRRQQVAQLIE